MFSSYFCARFESILLMRPISVLLDSPLCCMHFGSSLGLGTQIAYLPFWTCKMAKIYHKTGAKTAKGQMVPFSRMYRKHPSPYSEKKKREKREGSLPSRRMNRKGKHGEVTKLDPLSSDPLAPLKLTTLGHLAAPEVLMLSTWFICEYRGKL